MDNRVVALREDGLRAYIAVFVEETKKFEGVDVIINIPQAAENICALYFRYADEIIRPVVTSGIIQHYKIIAFMELSVLRVQPVYLESEDELTISLYNAKLALHIAISFFLDWNTIDPAKFKELIEKDGQLTNFIREHVTWLTNLDIRYYFPGFSNSQVWRLFHYLVAERIHKI